MPAKDNLLTIGETAKRCGVATSTLRFYESEKLIQSSRGPGNQRRYHRSMLRRISLVKVAQTLGLSLKEIGEISSISVLSACKKCVNNYLAVLAVVACH
jgi:MerR family redox-sensitive transcriptional activator SoxR